MRMIKDDRELMRQFTQRSEQNYQGLKYREEKLLGMPNLPANPCE